MKTDFTIFYSWQSDIGGLANKSYIKSKIEQAITVIKAGTPGINIELQESTSNEPGSPKIDDVIIQKITNCDIFVCDVTPVVDSTNVLSRIRKCMPNSNVLFELGYAVGAIGWDRIILVWNDQFGDAQYAPFDIRNHRQTHYRKNPDDMRTRINSLDMVVPINNIISDYDAILAKGIPSQELKYDIAQFRRTQDIMHEDELVDSLHSFYDHSCYTTYMFNRWDGLCYDYKTFPNHRYLNSDLDNAYREFLSNLNRMTSIGIREFVPLSHAWSYVNPEMTKEEQDEIYRGQQYTFRDHYGIMESEKAFEAQAKALNEISDSCQPLFDSYDKYRHIVARILHV